MKENDSDDEKDILETNCEQSENKIKNLKDDIISQEAYEQSENKATNLRDDLSFWEAKLAKLDENAKKALKENAQNVLENVIRNVKYENLDPNKVQNTKALSMCLGGKKIDKKDFLVALQNKDGNGPQVSLRKKLRLYMLLVSKNDRKFLDIFRLMNDWNYRFESNYFPDLRNYGLQNISEVRNFTQHDQYIEFFNGLHEGEKTLKNLLLMPSFIIFWNKNKKKKDESSQEKNDISVETSINNKMVDPYDKIIDDLFDQIKFNNDIQNNKEKYKQTIKNMHWIYVKSMNSSYEVNPNRCLATELKDQNGDLIDVSQTFSDFADMLFTETLIDVNARDRLKSGPNFLLLRLSVIWKYIKFFFRKNILRQKNIHYGYDSEILIKKINHFGNILAPGWFNCDVKYYNKIKADDGCQDHVSNFVYTANQYFKEDSRSVLGQMLIQKGLTEAQEKESTNFKKTEVKKENNVEKKEPEKEKEKEKITITTDEKNK